MAELLKRKIRGQVQKKKRHQPPKPVRIKRPKPEKFNPRNVNGRSVNHRARVLVSQRSSAWRRLDKLKERN